jgi:glycine/D-amino acid oxidase-like deaminating enzyme
LIVARTADVVIVGGGVVGASAAYHLAAAGAGSVLLLERADALGTGSTGACAGGFRHQFSSRVNILLSQASVPMILGFTEELGLPLDIHQEGYLFMVRSADLWTDYLASVELQRSMGVEVEVLTPQEARGLVPGISMDGMLGATFGPRDGIADPSGMTQGYATSARRAGASIQTGVEVKKVEASEGRVTGVQTSSGPISAPVVVNAAGPWAGQLAASVGVDVPLEPIPRQVVVTGPFEGRPERRTLVIDADSTFYFHREGPGVLMGMGGREEHASFDTRVDEGFIADELLPAAVELFPPLAEADVRHTWCGLYEMTPDRHPIIGEAPAVRGFFLANGFSGHGFQHAPIVGKLLAEMIVQGEATTVDVSPLGLERFAEGRPVRESHVV